MRVRADQRVGEGGELAGRVRPRADHVRQEFQVHLVDDAGPGRHNPEVAEALLRPAQERVTLAIALVLALDIDQKRRLRPVLVDLDRVVDHQVGGNQRIDAGRVAAHLGHGVPHGGEVDHARDAGEVLEDDARRHERELVLARVRWVPGGQRADVVGVHQSSARCGVPQHVLEQDLDGERQSREVWHARRVEPVVRIGPIAHAKRRARGGGVDRGGRTGHGMRLLRIRACQARRSSRSAPDGCARPGSRIVDQVYDQGSDVQPSGPFVG